MAEMLKGGVIMDVVDVAQAKIAEDAGAVAVMSECRQISEPKVA
jgi:pyridoxal 5'-phosphate synthase pdxS subunit